MINCNLNERCFSLTNGEVFRMPPTPDFYFSNCSWAVCYTRLYWTAVTLGALRHEDVVPVPCGLARAGNDQSLFRSACKGRSMWNKTIIAVIKTSNSEAVEEPSVSLTCLENVFAHSKMTDEMSPNSSGKFCF